ncbi:MAG: endonuclease [Erysipelotrichaceae bacterium]|jgi:endonuclease I|nr:endonuclease [Erysipelotrichaceae bacterium]
MKTKKHFIGQTLAAIAIAGVMGISTITTSGNWNIETVKEVPESSIVSHDDNEVTSEILRAVGTYYDGISTTATGTTLLSQLRSLNSNKRPKTVGYSNMGDYYKQTDGDPNNSSNIIAFYSGTSTSFNGSFSGSVNREHVWPNSKGGNLTEADIHMPRPTLTAENGSRGNSFYVEGMKHSSNGWDPAMESFGLEKYRGIAARIIFYCMTVSSSLNLVDTATSSASNTMGKLSDLLKWNLAYPIDATETKRNEAAQSIQGNRNAFIDHPEYACKIWGDTNSTTKSVCAAANTTTPSISLDKSSANIEAGTTTKLTATIENGTGSISWTSSSTSVATVSSNGTVTGVSKGVATITASTTISGTTYAVSCEVTVRGAGEALPAATDILTGDGSTFALSGSYADVEYTSPTSNATYVVQAMKNSNNIQMRTSGSKSFITKVSGGILDSVTITWASNTTSSRSIDLYGSNTAYASTSNGDITGTTKLTSINYSTTSTTYSFTDDYAYFAFIPVGGALYIQSIEVVWRGSSDPTPGPSEILTSIEITNNPSRISYVTGDQLSLSGLEVTANYSNNSSQVISTYTTSPAEGTVLSTVGNQEVTISFTDDGVTETTSFIVTVSGSGDPLPSSGSYRIQFDVNGTTDSSTVLTTSNFINEVTSGAEYIASFADINKVYAGKGGLKLGTSSAAGSFAINLSSLGTVNATQIAVGVKKYSSDTTSLSINGATSQSVSSTEYVELTYTISGTLNLINVSTTGKRCYISYIDVYYNSTDVEPPVDNPTLSSIAVGSMPSKVSYTVGETLNLTGLTILATYSDSTQALVTGYGTSPANGETLNTVGTQTITVTYTEESVTETTTFNITVSEATVALVSVSVEPQTDIMGIGETLQLTTTINPVAANPAPSITYSSSAEGVATVSSSGLVTSISAGTVTITVTATQYPSLVKTANCSITVESPQEEFVPTTTYSSGGTSYTLVEDISTLAAGDRLIIAYTTGNVALTQQNGSYRDRVSITISGNEITDISTATILTLGGSIGAWTLAESGGALLQLASSSNALTTNGSSSSNNAKWTISGNGTAVSIVSNAYNTRRIQYNTGAPRFACYTGTQKDPQLYREVSSGETLYNYNYLVDAFDGGDNSWCDLDLAGLNTLNERYEAMTTIEKDHFNTLSISGTTGLSAYTEAMAKRAQLLAASTSASNNDVTMDENSMIALVITITIASITLLGTFFYFKKRKEA